MLLTRCVDTFPVNVKSKLIFQSWSLYDVNIGALIVVFDYMSNMFAKHRTYVLMHQLFTTHLFARKIYMLLLLLFCCCCFMELLG